MRQIRISITYIWCTVILCLFFSACRGDDEILVRSQTQQVSPGGQSFFLLNEGNMGSNKATLDFYDGTLGTYRHNLFGEGNPTVTMELGDVGNDLAIYGSKLYAVINVSGLVEVMDAHTAKHLAAIQIPNCRYIVFDKGKAYVTSYAGEVKPNDPTSRRGFVARIDTATLKIETTVEVGYQPEQMAVVNGRLFVANSGGYRAPDYDTSISVIDLNTFQVVQTIDVAPNLHRIVLHDNMLYVTSRGNYADVEADVFVVNPYTMTVEQRLGIPADNIAFFGNDLLVLHSGQSSKRILRYNLSLHTTNDFITDGTFATIAQPYGIAVDERSKRVYITDARDYVSPGQLHCYDEYGKHLWQAQTGDIPAHFAFTQYNLQDPSSEHPTTQSVGINRVYAYCPAPGQFVNVLPEYTDGDTEATMCDKVFAAIGEGRQGIVTLGSAGGYLIAGFDHRIPNTLGQADIEIFGNAFEGASEAGIVSVMRDDNGNGLPDDTWYELRGSAHDEALRDYTISYSHSTDDHVAVSNGQAWCADAHHIAWHNGNGEYGWLAQNIYHRQPYFPRWITKNELTFVFTLLPDLAYQSGSTWLQPAFAWGYVDNQPNGTAGSQFDIGNAIDEMGNSIPLDGIDFIKIHTAVFRQMDAIGEASTEVTAIRALH